MQGVIIGHLGLYNKNQIRDELFLVLIFLKIILEEVAEWQGCCIGSERAYYMQKDAVSAVWCVYYEICKNDGTLE